MLLYFLGCDSIVTSDPNSWSNKIFCMGRKISLVPFKRKIIQVDQETVPS